MLDFRVMSIEDPLRGPETSTLAFGLLARGQTMGFLPKDTPKELRLDRTLLAKLAQELASAGVAGVPLARLNGAKGSALETALRDTIAAVDASPMPKGEWETAREVLGDDLLARLLRISASSLRRYATGERATPDEVAWRLHTVARLLAALVGSYNEYGVRLWFDRARSQLDEQTPAAVIMAAGTPDDPALERVVRLADALLGPGGAT